MPGCVSQGETLDELKANITEAILACREAYAASDGEPEPASFGTWTLRISGGESIPA
jgi:predicted RNase H-like HicB family nuclease